MTHRFVVTGTDTNVGKTLFTGLFGRFLLSKKLKVNLLKPFCTGDLSDAQYLAQASYNSLNKINYWFYPKPVSPASAQFKGVEIDINNIYKKIKINLNCDFLLLEGVGGFLSPIAHKINITHIADIIGADYILVAPNKIGVINQILLNLEFAKYRKKVIKFIILMQQEQPDLSYDDNKFIISKESGFDLRKIIDFPWLGKSALDHNLFNKHLQILSNQFDLIYSEL